MKKFLFFYILMIASGSLFSQTYSILDINNTKVGFNADGALFWDYSTPSYEAPAGSGIQAIYAGGVWLSMMDTFGAKYGIGQTYTKGEFYTAGPFGNVYDVTYKNRYDKVWRVTKAEIDYHIAHYMDAGYILPTSISNWPAHGDPSNGEADNLAPFVDIDHDWLYEPAQGEYPKVPGDQNIFIMFKTVDSIGISPSPLFEAEIHAMFYANNVNPLSTVNNTVFANFRVFNRSLEVWKNIRFGVWADVDLGCYYNDFIGCDTARNSYYVYNGTEVDETCIVPAYEQLKTALGIKYLTTPLSSFMTYANDFSVIGNPYNSTDYYRYMRNIWKDDQPMTWGGNGTGGTIPTNYLYPSNPNDSTGWSEVTAGNSPNDRREMGTTELYTLVPNASACVNMAFVFTMGDSSMYDHLTIVNKLFSDLDFIQNYFETNIDVCGNVLTLGISENTTSSLRLYPNPAQDYIFIENIFSDKNIEILIFDTKGRLVLSKIVSSENKSSLEVPIASLPSGLYFVKMIQDEKRASASFVKD